MRKLGMVLIMMGIMVVSGCEGKNISEEEARKIVLEDAQVSEKEVSFTVEGKDEDEYHFVFLSDTHKYVYEVDVEDGKIEEKHIEAIKKEENKISESQAKQKVLEYFNINEEDIYDYSIELEKGYYDIDFKVENYEYSADVDVNTGKILHSNKELD